MARKITMFELHFEAPLFGESKQHDKALDVGHGKLPHFESEDDDDRSVGRLLLLITVTSIVVSVLASIIAKRLLADEPNETA